MESKKTAGPSIDDIYASLSTQTQYGLKTIKGNMERRISEIPSEIAALQKKRDAPNVLLSFLAKIGFTAPLNFAQKQNARQMIDLQSEMTSLQKLQNNHGEYRLLARNPGSYNLSAQESLKLGFTLEDLPKKKKGLTDGAHSTGMEAQTPTAERKKTL